MTFFVTPPTKPGLYWILDERDPRWATGIPQIAELLRGGEVAFIGTDVAEWNPIGIRWGDRIEVPTCE